MIQKAIKLKKGKLVSKPLKNDGNKIDYLVTAIRDMKLDMRDMQGDLRYMQGDIHDLKGMTATLEEVKRRGDATFEMVGELGERVANIEISQKEMAGDVQVLKQDVGVLKQDVGVLKQDVGTLKQDVRFLQQDVVEIKGDVKRINNNLTRKTDVEWTEKLDGRVVKMEKFLKLSVA